MKFELQFLSKHAYYYLIDAKYLIYVNDKILFSNLKNLEILVKLASITFPYLSTKCYR